MGSVQSDSPPVKSELSPRNKLYAKIDKNLSEDEVKTLRAMLTTDRSTLDINKGQIEKASPHDIFNMLENGGKIGEGNLGLLKELLKHLGQGELAKEAGNLEKEENMKLASMSKRKATEDANSAKQKRMSGDSEGTDDSDSSAESGIGCRSSSSQSMETDDFENGDLTASARCSADGSTLETVDDVVKRIAHLQKKIEKLNRNPKNISKEKTEENSKACQELDHLVKLLDKQSRGELKIDITPLDTETQKELQKVFEAGTLHQKIGEEVKQIMQSTSDDIDNVKLGVKVESTNFSPGRLATIKVTAEAKLANNCKLDKDSAVRRLFKYLVQENPQKLRPITRYLNSFDVQVQRISYGSIDFECLCLTPESAVRLQQEYDGKNLQAEFQRVISSLAILTEFGIRSICLAVDLKFADEVSAGVPNSSASRQLSMPTDNEEVVESLQSKLAQMEVDPEPKWHFESTTTSPGERRNMARLRFETPNVQDAHQTGIGLQVAKEDAFYKRMQERKMQEKWEAIVRRRQTEEEQKTRETEWKATPMMLKSDKQRSPLLKRETGPNREVASGSVVVSNLFVHRVFVGTDVAHEVKGPSKKVLKGTNEQTRPSISTSGDDDSWGTVM